jgi:5'(3')-deoxyribonucleotidase
MESEMKLNELSMEQEPQEKSYAIFCDLDGVLADFKSELSQKVFKDTSNDLGGTGDYSDERYANDPKFRSHMWKAVAHYQKKHGFVVWRDLELLPDAMQLWNHIKRHNPQILTATGDEKYRAAEQKREWVTKHFGSAIRINFVKAAPLKVQFAGPNRILIDDQLRAIDPWVAGGGIGIHHTNAAHTISELKKLGIL